MKSEGPLTKARGGLADSFGRTIDYLRISVTDRCNFRCTYCMPEHARFLSRSEALSADEIVTIAERFIQHGVRRIRLTGGEPLVRKDIRDVLSRLGRNVREGALDELTLTTNGSLLTDHVAALADAPVRRINVSLDSLDPARFAAVTRGGKLAPVLAGIDATLAAGIAIRINMVAMRGVNEDDLLPVAHYCAARGMDLAVIEAMPLGEEIVDRRESHISAEDFIAPLRADQALRPLGHRSAGPARYFAVEPLGLRLGVITPLSHNFCGDCNRLRLTTEGALHPCLGHGLSLDFRAALRERGLDGVDRLIAGALRIKPKEHDFVAQLADGAPRLARTMNVTGG